jgi:peptidoglycan/LPS O-acetylase OafA/YrhL
VRFFFAIVVVFHHSGALFIPALAASRFQYAHVGLFGDLYNDFNISVSFFFMLSGYSLSSAYLKTGQVIDQRKFLFARVARLYPLYFVVLVLDAPFFLLTQMHSTGRIHGLISTAEIFAANVLLLQAWAPSILLHINDPSWSLCAEFFFYICFPLLGAWLWKLRGAQLWITALALYAGGMALVWAVRPHVGILFVSYFPLLHFSTFVLGILLARWQWLRRERNGPGGVAAWQANAILGAAVVALILCAPLEPFLVVKWPYSHGLLAPLYVLIIWSLSTTPSALTRWLSGKWMQALGNGSYAMYLIHFPLLELFVRCNWVRPQTYPLYFACCVGFSLLSFPFFETPVRSWLMKRFESHRSSGEVVALSASSSD